MDDALAERASKLVGGGAVEGSAGGRRGLDESAPSRCGSRATTRHATVQLRRVSSSAADAGPVRRRERLADRAGAPRADALRVGDESGAAVVLVFERARDAAREQAQLAVECGLPLR